MLTKLKRKINALRHRRRSDTEQSAEPSNVHVMLQVWTEKAHYNAKRSLKYRLKHG